MGKKSFRKFSKKKIVPDGSENRKKTYFKSTRLIVPNSYRNFFYQNSTFDGP